MQQMLEPIKQEESKRKVKDKSSKNPLLPLKEFLKNQEKLN